MIPKKTWILVADGTRARILKDEGFGEGLVSALDHGFHRSAEPVHEMGTERPGHGHQSAGGGRFAIEPKTDWSRDEERHFAKTLADTLETHARQKDFDRLVLIAPPRALGHLRLTLGAHAEARLAGEINKDLTEHSVEHVAQELKAAHLL